MTSLPPAPQSAGAAFARLYDFDLADDPGDLDLYLALAERAAGPILELAVGTGRLAVPLAVAGFAVTGVDLDPAMLARAADRAAAEGPDVVGRLALVEGDARSIRLPAAGTFALAFVALNSLMLVGDEVARADVFGTLAAHLAPGGVAAVDVWLPDAEDLARYDGRITLEAARVDPETGHLVTKAASALHDHVGGTVRLSSIWEEGRQGEPPVRWYREDLLSLVSAAELARLATGAGLEVEVLAGDYELDPIEPSSDRAVLVARRPGGL